METEMEREFSELAIWVARLERARREMELLQMARAEMLRRDMEHLQVVSEDRKMLVSDSEGLMGRVFKDLELAQAEMVRYYVLRMVVSEDRKMLVSEDLMERFLEDLTMVRREMVISEDRKMGVFEDLGMWGFGNKPESRASSSKITILNDTQEVPDLEMGFTPGEVQLRQVLPNSGMWFWKSFRDYLSWTTKGKRFKPHQPRPSENAEPGPEPEPELEPPHDDDYGEVKEAKGGLSKVTLATQMVLPAAVGWGGYFVIGEGALYNSAFAFSVFGLHILGILSMFLGWYLGTKTPRVSERMQILGQALCIACLILTQIPVSNKLK